MTWPEDDIMKAMEAAAADNAGEERAPKISGEFKIDEQRQARRRRAEVAELGPARPFSWRRYFMQLFSVPLVSAPILVFVIAFGRSVGIPSAYCAIIFLGTLAVNAGWLKWGGIFLLHGNPVAECPQCGTRVRYLAQDHGRDVQCTACEHIWPSVGKR